MATWRKSDQAAATEVQHALTAGTCVEDALVSRAVVANALVELPAVEHPDVPDASRSSIWQT
jgi:hypothetical protein